MTIDDLKSFHKKIIEEYDMDSNWNPSTIKHHLTTLSGTIAKYLNYWSRLKHIIIQIDEEYNEKYMILYSHYRENSNINYTVTEIKDLISKDNELCNIRVKKSTAILIMEYIEKCVDNLNKTRYDLSNYIEIEKFLNGKG
ncbi:putative DNA repair and recombination protein [Campylobacter phage vB_CjeM_Los1]|uniref:Putative DNA repair and recombination protein n=1 Tax=Campylobacter phage vB_CjeM_Los1 TaxID=1904491 RepID=A0A1D8EX89_9CAUD|nr:putative DNA repair and recombination protein [Campylobacter phage vB_CjeM_Los1]AOT25859.1 putative DNA repair and recombination protein [Campylobacter phage vB_CjeM_Los1]